MARAGFWPIGGYEISFRTDGCWYADDEVIANDRIARLFSRHVRRDQCGGSAERGESGERWVIDLGIDRQPVRIEDTALVVTSVDGDPEHGVSVRTNDDIVSDLDPATLEIGRGNVLYCTVDRGDRGRIRARFLRPAYYSLARWVRESPDGPAIEIGGVSHAIRGPR